MHGPHDVPHSLAHESARATDSKLKKNIDTVPKEQTTDRHRQEGSVTYDTRQLLAGCRERVVKNPILESGTFYELCDPTDAKHDFGMRTI